MIRRFGQIVVAGGLAAALLLLAMIVPRGPTASQFGYAAGLASAAIPQAATAAGTGQVIRPNKVAAQLWEDTADGRPAAFLIVLTEQADTSAASRLRTKADRSRYVYDRLRAVALRSQASLRSWLEAQDIPYKPHYLVNMLAVTGERALLAALARRPDVARLEANPWVAGVAPVTASGPRQDRWLWRRLPASVRAATEPQTTEWGIRFVKAPSVWNRYDSEGQGIVIGGQDTGYQWDHPALRNQYRGWDGSAADHNYNWHDAIGGNSICPDPAVPCDDYGSGHGTHTMGIMVGDDGLNNQIGVAPQAQWIGCRNMDLGNGTPSSYTECFEFLLAPYPLGGDPLLDGDPSLGAHVINNSWHCPPSEGCGVDTLRQVVENVRAAGIMVVAAAGNQGYQGCSSIHDPIALFEAAFTVGSVADTGLAAGSSSRGPVTVDGSGRLKPDVAAPGVNVRSSTRDGGYGVMSGTSMAAPHVAGVVALLWSADPTLLGQIDDTEMILTRTAEPVVDTGCGSGGWPNNTYGWGYVNALAAVEAVREPARVQGQVLQVGCQNPITTTVAGAQVTFVHAVSQVTTTTIAADGVFSLTLPAGPYTVTATFPHASATLTQTLRLWGNQDNPLDFVAERRDSRCVYWPVIERNG